MGTRGRHDDADGPCAARPGRKNKKMNVKERRDEGESYARLHGQASRRQDA